MDGTQRQEPYVPNTSILTAARYLCELSDWKLSNIELQKLLYFAQTRSLGRDNSVIFQGDFEAWPMGPVSVDLYHKVKSYESGCVKDIPEIIGDKLSSNSKSLLKSA